MFNEWNEEVGKEQRTRSKEKGSTYDNCLINAFIVHASNDWQKKTQLIEF